MIESPSALPEGVRFAVSPLSWTNDVMEDMGADISLETCLTDAAEVGYQGVELGRKFPRNAETLAALLYGHGLALASGWYSGGLAERGVDGEMEAVKAHATLLKAMGCKVMVYGEVGMMAPGSPLDVPLSRRLLMPADNVPAYAERLTDFGKRLQGSYGITVAYHHHLMMVAETFDEVCAIFDKTGPEVGLLLDTGHAAGGGFDYTRLIERFAERIVHIHLKDIRGDVMSDVRNQDTSFNDGVRRGMFTVPGDGDLDFTPLSRFVVDSRYTGWLVVEAEQDPDVAPPRPTVTRAFNHVLATFAALRR